MKIRFWSWIIVAPMLYSVGCTTTVVEKSAQSKDPAVVFEQQMKRAERFHRRNLISTASRHYTEAIRSSQAFPPPRLRLSPVALRTGSIVWTTVLAIRLRAWSMTAFHSGDP